MSEGVRELFIVNIANNNDTKSLKISGNKTVLQLKDEIKKLFNLNYNLDDQRLRIQNSAGTPKVIRQENEKNTLIENNIKGECRVFFGQQANRGGC
jgi:hypothetical protein